ncbi:MAG: class I tRNA ligase family protein, partial [Terriglobia bacterium]
GEILRLWVSAQDYRDDVRISQEILNQLVEVYRKIRNTCRFMLSNLYDFNSGSYRVPFDQLPELDRWALLKLYNLIEKVKKSYEDFDFRQIIHELDYFCTKYMSAVYLDILKDRLYTFRADSPLRRGSQTVLFEIVVAMTKLMAPVLSFTAEEIWRTMPEACKKSVGTTSVHLAAFPDITVEWINPDMEQRWEDLLYLRGEVQAKLEGKRREGVIGAPLEAKVTIYAQRANPAMYDVFKPYENFLSTLFIVSQVELVAVDNVDANIMSDLSDGFGVVVDRASGRKCERCWNYRPAVGTFSDHPTLCDRCVEAVQ